MVQLEINSSREMDLAVDLEVGWNAVSCEEEESPEPNPKNLLNRAYNGFVSNDTSCKITEALMSGNDYYSLVESPIESGEVSTGKRFGGGGEVSPLVKKVGGDEKPKKKKSSKKPPRPPRAPSMDVVDQKILQEMAEIAMLKRARIERMKALQKMKNSKSASSNNSLYALFITIIFCLMIIWQGYGLGISDALNDTERINYLHAYIGSMLSAMRDGSDVRGYFVWSFLDVFEFLAGYNARLGLYYVDFEDVELKRQPKLSARWYSNFLMKKNDEAHILKKAGLQQVFHTVQ